jgi:hypothetical protein
LVSIDGSHHNPQTPSETIVCAFFDWISGMYDCSPHQRPALRLQCIRWQRGGKSRELSRKLLLHGDQRCPTAASSDVACSTGLAAGFGPPQGIEAGNSDVKKLVKLTTPL